MLQETIFGQRHPIKSMACQLSQARETNVRKPDPILVKRPNLSTTPSSTCVSFTTTLVNSDDPKHSLFPAASIPPMPPAPRQYCIPHGEPGSSKNEHDVHADLHWEINPRNPKNWSETERWVSALIPGKQVGYSWRAPLKLQRKMQSRQPGVSPSDLQSLHLLTSHS